MQSMQSNPKRNGMNQFQRIVQERFTETLEIYYESNVHKKFLADVYAVIPKGKKCAVWFTHQQCWMFQIAKRPYQPGQPSQPGQFKPKPQLEPVTYDDVRMLNMPCMDDSWYNGKGTILYGTYMFDKKRFSVENVHYFCGAKQQNDGSMKRFIDFFDSLKKCKMEAAQLQFFMPIMHSSFGEALNDAMNVKSYEVYCIQHLLLKRDCSEYKNLLIHLAQSQSTPQSSAQQVPTPSSASSFFPKQAHSHAQAPASAQAHVVRSTTRTFILKPDVQNDIYYVLHRMDEPITTNTMIAHIPNYKTSVMMNSLFRNIKENRNLDALEESDDEDEFADSNNKTQFVDLTKCVKMECAFNHRFKRWQPCA